MDRRDFLKNSLLLGLTGAAAAAASCATTQVRVPQPHTRSRVDMHDYLAQLDHSLFVIDRADTLRDFRAVAHDVPDHEPAGFASSETLTKKTFGALAITGAFLDLDEDDRTHPGMQERMWGAMDDMDLAVDGTVAMLGALPGSERDAVRQRITNEPELLERVSAAIEEKAVLAGLPDKRRRHLRRLVTLVGSELRERGSDGMIHQFMTAAANARSVARRNAQEAPGAPAAGPPPPPVAPATPPVAPPPAPETQLTPMQIAPEPAGPMAAPVLLPAEPFEPPPPQRVHRHWISSGGITLGIGVGLGLLSAGLIAAGGGALFVGMFVATAGAVGLILGLIFLIIGAARGGDR
jgi:hypothetical protein